MAKKKKISLIIPCRNMGDLLEDTFKSIAEEEKKLPYDLEVIFMNDRSTDDTAECADKFGKLVKDYRRIDTDPEYVGNGKGMAVQMGMAAATGDYKMFMDADNSTPFTEVEKYLPYIDKYDMIIGNRYGEKVAEPETNWFKAVWRSALDVLHVIVFGYSKLYRAGVRQGRFRQLVGRGANAAFTLLLGQNFVDQRCGFKLYNADVADIMFPKLNIMTWDFETEIYAMAKKYKYSIIQVPVRYDDEEEESNFKPRDMINGFKAIFQVYYYTLRGDYRNKKAKK